MARSWDNVGEASWIERATQQNPWWLQVLVRSTTPDGLVLVEPTSAGHSQGISEDWVGCRCAFAPDGGGVDIFDSDTWISGKVDVVDRRGTDEPPLIAVRLWKPGEALQLPSGATRYFSVREHDFYESLTAWADATHTRGGPDGPGSLGPDDWMRSLTRQAARGGVRPPAPASIAFDGSKRRAIEGSPLRLRAIWGPPGTGKTFTAGHIVTTQLRAGKRVMVLSISNRAVDQAILGADDAWRLQHGGQPPADNTTLVRVREPRHPDLEHRDRAHLIAGWEEAVRPWKDARTQVLRQLRDARQHSDRVRLAGELVALKAGLEAAQKALVSRARSIFATLTHQRMSSMMPAAAFDLVIVDEAGFAGAAVASLIASESGPSTQVVFSGDFQQIEPIVGFKTAAPRNDRRQKVVRRPFPPVVFNDFGQRREFPWADNRAERDARLPFVQAWYADSAYAMLGIEDRVVGRDAEAARRRQDAARDGWLDLLDVQRRMPSALGDFLSERVYGGLGVVTSPPGWSRPLGPLRDAAGDRAPMLWLEATKEDGKLMSGWTWQLDSRETARICVQAALRALQDPAVKVFVLTRFNAQVREIRTQLERSLDSTDGRLGRVEVTTVHKAQGGEREVVIFDTIVTTPWWLAGKPLDSREWRNELRQVNVALSRAKRQVLVLLHREYATDHPIFAEYIKVASQVTPGDMGA
jgi:hypothetical protein